MKYVKTVPIEAEQLTGFMDIAKKFDIRIEPDPSLFNRDSVSFCDDLIPKGKYFLPTLEGEMEVNIGDYIATGVDGEHWAIKEDVFKKTYKPVGSDDN